MRTTAEAWMVAGVVARAFTHDGRPIGRALAWPAQYLIALNTAAFAARDVVWDRTSSGSIATAVVPCRSARPRHIAGGAIVSVLGLDALIALAVIGAMVASSLVSAWLFVLVVAALLAPPTAVMGPMVTRRSRVGERALRQWRRALQAQGHTVVIATYVAAWPLGGGAGGQLMRQVAAESRRAGQLVIAYARNDRARALYVSPAGGGAISHPDNSAVVLWQ